MKNVFIPSIVSKPNIVSKPGSGLLGGALGGGGGNSFY